MGGEYYEAGVVAGMMALLRGLRLLLTKPLLRAVLWRIVAVLALLFLLVTGGVFWLADTLIQQWAPAGDAWYWQLLGWLAWMCALVLSLLAGVVAFVTLGSALVAPWLDQLAQRAAAVDGYALPNPQQGWMALCRQSLANSLRPLASLLMAGVAALLLWWIPVVGQLAAPLVWGYASVRYLCFELMDTHATRFAMDYSARLEQWRQHRGFWLVFSAAAMLMLMVPLLNLLVLPAAVVGLAGYPFANDEPKELEFSLGGEK
ncbi:MAG: EI24 domain-containing protein [Mariprofundales bacterium]